MRNLLSKAVVLIGAGMMLVSMSFASILCGGTPTTISAITAGGGCQFGSDLFSNVSIATSTEGGGAPADAIDPGHVQLAFTGVTTNPGTVNVIITDSDAASWALTNSMQFDLILTYTVTGSAPYFTTFSDNFVGNNSSNVNGTGAISFDKTANGQSLPTLSFAMQSAGPMNLTGGGGGISTFNVVDNVIVHATNASATLTSATNSFQEITIVAPEPMTMMLLGSGLLAFGFVVRRKRGV